MLDVSEVSVRFGGRLVLQDVSLNLERGKISALIGPNGAGKTTLFNVITGFQTADRGSVRLNGQDITGKSPHRRARRGVARTFQRLELFGSLTVRENLAVAVNGNRRRSKAHEAITCDEIMARFDLVGVADQLASTLPIGLGRILELARAIVSEPEVLLLDEPASGLDEFETQGFDKILRELASTGLCIAVVEHDISLVMSLCDPVYVLDQGTIIAKGSPADVQADPAVRNAYLGDLG